MKIILYSFVFLFFMSTTVYAQKQVIKALYIPLADHYAALVAYEKYASTMRYAKFELQQMKNWDLLRAYFQDGYADMAYVMSPLALDMYHEQPDFKWIGLMHRDGNALAINSVLASQISLKANRAERKPNEQLAMLMKKIAQKNKQHIEIGLPHVKSTHAAVLYKYFSQYGLKVVFSHVNAGEILGISIAPPKSPAFLRINAARATPAAFEQSLPWAEIVETQHYGKIVWYSKDVMQQKYGHVECIAIAKQSAIKQKNDALREVMHFIHKAAQDIEIARKEGGDKLLQIVKIIQKHIPSHTKDAIVASLDPKLNVINYTHLDVDKDGMQEIMNYALEGNIIQHKVDLEEFSDESFSSKETWSNK